jgi:hypothetical protein
MSMHASNFALIASLLLSGVQWTVSCLAKSRFLEIGPMRTSAHRRTLVHRDALLSGDRAVRGRRAACLSWL